MKKILLSSAVALVLGAVTGCSAAAVKGSGDNVQRAQRYPSSDAQHLSGVAATDFIEKHFPNADIPGEVDGSFTYVKGIHKKGHAKCFVPAMGGESDGEVPTCDVTETNNYKITGTAAEEFIGKHFPNADIPGPVEGNFTFIHGVLKKGTAKCFYPAMGGVADGVVPTCDVNY